MNKLIVKLDDKIIENFESTDGMLLVKGGVSIESDTDFNICNSKECSNNCFAYCKPK